MSDNNEKRCLAHQIILDLFKAKEAGQIQLLLMACSLAAKQLDPESWRKFISHAQEIQSPVGSIATGVGDEEIVKEALLEYADWWRSDHGNLADSGIVLRKIILSALARKSKSLSEPKERKWSVEIQRLELALAESEQRYALLLAKHIVGSEPKELEEEKQ